MPNTTYFRGRVALAAILRALGIGAGDEVVLQAFTCVAVPEAVIAVGARAVWADVVPGGFTMDADSLRRSLTPATRAIVIQHTYGIPADMGPLMEVAREAGLPVVEDCCHTYSSRYRSEPVGGFGVASFYSYEWGKPIVAGLGGGVLVNDAALLARIIEDYDEYSEPSSLRLARIQATYYAYTLLFRPRIYWQLRSAFHKMGSAGIIESNYNPVGELLIASDFHLRMAPSLERRLKKKLTYEPAITAHSRKVASIYGSRIQSEAVVLPTVAPEKEIVYARFPLVAKDKPALLEAARKANVEMSSWYSTPVHPLEGASLAQVDYELGSCPNAESICDSVVTLPTHPGVGPHDVLRTIRFLNGRNS